MNSPASLLAAAVEPELSALRNLNDSDLLARVTGWLEQETPDGTRYSGDWRARLETILSERVRPVLQKMGDKGAELWNYLCDAESAWNKDRIAALVLALGVALGIQNLDMSTGVAIIVLAIKLKSGGAS